jgi:hypothetical protein
LRKNYFWGRLYIKPAKNNPYYHGVEIMNKISVLIFILGFCLKLVAATGADSIETADTLYSNDSLNTEKSSETETAKSTLIISTEPSEAIVLFNDSVRGVTPLTISDVDTGVHTITLRKKGCYQKKVELRIDSVQKKELHFVLQQPSSLCIITEPAGATLYLNQKSVGKSPYSGNQLKPGEYRIGAEMEHYQSVEQTHSLESNVSDTIKLTLNHTTAYLDSVKASEIKEKKRQKLFNRIFIGGAFALFGLVLLIIEAKE